MKNIYFLLSALLFCLFTVGALHAEDISKAINKKAAEVGELQISFGDYIVGRKLSAQQKKMAAEHPLSVSKKMHWTYKFQDGDVYVVAEEKTDLIIGLYKEKKKASRQDVKDMVGDLMMNFEEPTVMAHDKMIYWAFDKKGKVSGDLFEESKDTGELETLVTVKFTSTEPIFREERKETAEKEKVEEKTADIYVIISSGPLSSLFMAQNK